MSEPINPVLDALIESTSNAILQEAAKRAIDKIRGQNFSVSATFEGGQDPDKVAKAVVKQAKEAGKPKRKRRTKAEIAAAKAAKAAAMKPEASAPAPEKKGRGRRAKATSEAKAVVIGATDKTGAFLPLDQLPPSVKDFAQRVNSKQD